MNEITLSYVLTTYNKLPYLKLVMNDLLNNCREGEEIIVTDGGSTDGTVQYLQELYRDGKIHQLVSGKDFGEAHGFNRGILMARGEIVKLLSDDDVFDYEAIRLCKNYLLANKGVDMIATNGIGEIMSGQFTPFKFDTEFGQYAKNKIPFPFTGLGLIFRRTSLSIFGLFNTSFKRVDAEFSLRVTASKSNLVWYTGYTWLHLGNNDSNSHKFRSQMESELERLKSLYIPREKPTIKKTIRKSLSFIKNKGKAVFQRKPASDQSHGRSEVDYQSHFTMAVKVLHEFNKSQPFQFLTKENA